MDIERAVVTAALNSGQIALLPSKKISASLIFQEDVKEVFEWALMYARHYGQSPSGPLLRERFPDWRPETVADPLEALVVEFLDAVKRRYFEAFVLELSEMPRQPNYRESWGRLDEIFLDKARELAGVLPSGNVGSFAADMVARADRYEIEANEGVRPGMNMGIPVIDQITLGIKHGWLVTNAGYSGRGKSLLSTFNLLNIFEQDKVGLMLSAEMSVSEVLERLDTMVVNFRHRDLMHRNLPTPEVERWKGIARVYSKAAGEIYIVDKMGGTTVDRIFAEIQRYKPDVCVVDYVQRFRGTRASTSKWEGLEEITNELKTIAMDTDTAVIMVSQDNRSSAEQGSTETNMGNSVSVYQAADVYIGMMQDPIMKQQNKMRIKLIKFRHGDNAEVDVWWQPSTGEFGRLYTDADQFQKPQVPA